MNKNSSDLCSSEIFLISNVASVCFIVQTAAVINASAQEWKALVICRKNEFWSLYQSCVGIALTTGSLFRFGIIWQERNVVLIVSQKQHLAWHEAAKVTFQRSLCCKWFSNDTNSNRLNCKPGNSRDLWVVKDFETQIISF